MQPLPRILVVSPTFPFPLISGGKIRIHNILKQLSKDYNVTLLALTESELEVKLAHENLSFLEKIISVTIQQNKISQIWRLLCNLHKWLMGTPAEVLVKHSAVMQYELNKLLATNEFKALQIEYSQGMVYLPKTLPGSIPIILVSHDVSFVAQERKAQIIKNLSRFFWKAEAKKMKAYELDIWRRCECIITMSDIDKEKIHSLNANVNVEVVPNGVNVPEEINCTESEVPTIVFVGWMRHLPNRDGLLWFIEKIWPIIREINKEVCFYVVGKNIPRTIRNIVAQDSRVKLLGYVENIEETVKDAWVSVVPIRIGSGSRLKILESMSLGTPVVSTTVGCEGLDVKVGDDIAVADQPEMFSRLVLEFLEDPNNRRKMAQKAYQLVGQKYSWETIGIKARQIMKHVVEGYYGR